MTGVFMSPESTVLPISSSAKTVAAGSSWQLGPHGSTFSVLIFGFFSGGEAHDLLTLLPFKHGNDEKPACEKGKQSPPLPP